MGLGCRGGEAADLDQRVPRSGAGVQACPGFVSGPGPGTLPSTCVPLLTQLSPEPGFCHYPNPHPPLGLSEPQLLFGRTDGFLFSPWQKMNSLF